MLTSTLLNSIASWVILNQWVIHWHCPIIVYSTPFKPEQTKHIRNCFYDSGPVIPAYGSHSCKFFNILLLPFPVKPTKSLKAESDTSTSTGNPSITLLCFLKIRRQSHMIYELTCLPPKNKCKEMRRTDAKHELSFQECFEAFWHWEHAGEVTQ